MPQYNGRGLEVCMVVVLLAGCAVEPPVSRGAKGVCEALRRFGVETAETTRDGGYACRAAGTPNSNVNWRDITVTAYAPPTNQNLLEGVLLEGRYSRSGGGQTTKREMMVASNAVFSRLDMDAPAGLELAIQTRSQSEVSAGKMRVSVDHLCETDENTPCRIQIHIRNVGGGYSSQTRLWRR